MRSINTFVPSARVLTGVCVKGGRYVFDIALADTRARGFMTEFPLGEDRLNQPKARPDDF